MVVLLVVVVVVVTVVLGYTESYLWVNNLQQVYLGSLAMREKGKDQTFVRNTRNSRNKASYEMKTSTSYLIDMCVINPELILYTKFQEKVNCVAFCCSFSSYVTPASQQDVSGRLAMLTRLRVQQVSVTIKQINKTINTVWKPLTSQNK